MRQRTRTRARMFWRENTQASKVGVLFACQKRDWGGCCFDFFVFPAKTQTHHQNPPPKRPQHLLPANNQTANSQQQTANSQHCFACTYVASMKVVDAAWLFWSKTPNTKIKQAQRGWHVVSCMGWLQQLGAVDVTFTHSTHKHCAQCTHNHAHHTQAIHWQQESPRLCNNFSLSSQQRNALCRWRSVSTATGSDNAKQQEGKHHCCPRHGDCSCTSNPTNKKGWRGENRRQRKRNKVFCCCWRGRGCWKWLEQQQQQHTTHTKHKTMQGEGERGRGFGKAQRLSNNKNSRGGEIHDDAAFGVAKQTTQTKQEAAVA